MNHEIGQSLQRTVQRLPLLTLVTSTMSLFTVLVEKNLRRACFMRNDIGSSPDSTRYFLPAPFNSYYISLL